jgi:beta-phosphoglucomutase-like phosphatase (HAD superfamily)
LLDLPADVGACLFHGDGVLTHTARVDGIVPDSEHLDGKPVPDTFLEGAGVPGVEPREAAVVEDAPAWVAAGRARRFGGAVPVDRADQADALRRQGGDVVVSDVVELLERP